MECYQKSLKIQEEIGDKGGLAASFTNIGVNYNNMGDISKALEYYHKALTIQEEIGDKEGIAVSLHNFGFLYSQQKDYLKGLEYFHKSLKITEEIQNEKGMAISLNSIGYLTQQQGDLLKALEYYNKGLKIQSVIGDKRGIAISLNSIGSVYEGQGDIPMALEYYHKSLKLRKEIEDKEGMAFALDNIANALILKGDYSAACTFAKKGMQVAKELGFPENIRNSAESLKKIFQKQNKYKDAFEMFELEVKMRDSINNEETQKAAVKKQMQYQYETQARELKNEQDKKDIIAKAELQQREKERNYFVLGFALVIVLAGFIFRSYRQKQKANILIAQQKHEVEESRKEILDSIHYAKRIQRAMIPSDKFIQNNLNRLQKKG